MANISKIKLPSGVTYDVVDNTSGYITGYTETDPVFSASPAAGITDDDIYNWNYNDMAASGVGSSGNSSVFSINFDRRGVTTDFNNFMLFVANDKPFANGTTFQVYAAANESRLELKRENLTIDGVNYPVQVKAGLYYGTLSAWSNNGVMTLTSAPKGNDIPTKTSDLTNDSGFITSYIDTKNTAGSTYSTSQLYLIGAMTEEENPQTYSNSNLYYYNGLVSRGEYQNYISDINQTGDQIGLYITDQSSGNENGVLIDSNGVSIYSDSGHVAISNLAAPVNNTDATNKKYVDDSIAAIPAASITLNGTSTTSASFYAPTAVGTSGQFLKSNGSGAPTWVDLPTDSPDTLVIHLVRTGNESEYDIDSSFSIIYALYHNNKFIYLVDTDMERIYYLKTITQSVARFSRIDYSEYEDNSTITKAISEDYFFINDDDTIEFHQYSSLVPTKTSDLTNDSGFITSYTDEKLKWTTSTSSGTFYPLQSTSISATSTANTLNSVSFYQYYNTAGGYRRLTLGNSGSYTSSGGAYGKIRLYGTGATYYGDINPGTIGANSLTANRTWTLPNATGTIALTSDITDAKNRAGATNSTSKLYLIGATEQSANPQTYSNSNLYYSSGLTSTSPVTPSGNYTSIDQDAVSILVYSTDNDSYEYDFSVGNEGIEITDGSNNTVSLTSNGLEIHGLVTPTSNTDAANKKYVDDSVAAISTNWLNGSATGSVRTSGSTTEDSNYTMGNYAVAEGHDTEASGNCSHAAGLHTIAQRTSQTVIGQYNILDTSEYPMGKGDYLFIIGNGTANARSNALAVKWDGTVETAKGNLSGVQIVRW